MESTSEMGTAAEQASGAQLWRLNTMGLVGQAFARQIYALDLDLDSALDPDGLRVPISREIAHEVLSEVEPEARESGVWQQLIF